MAEPVENQKAYIILFIWLSIAGLFGILVGVPWSLSVLEDSETIWVSAVAEFLLFLLPASAVGVWLGKKSDSISGLMYLISKDPDDWDRLRRGFLPALLGGLTLGGAGFFAQDAIPNNALISGLNNPSTFEWFLRCLSAALTEEIFFRFGLLTLFAWVIRLIIKNPAGMESSLWFGNLFSALVFAGAHLPQMAFHGLILLIPVILFSTGAGMVMGWLFIRHGLVSAILGHFIADLIVYILPKL